MRYVRDVHRPTRMMVLSDEPLSFNAMAPPARRLCEEMRSMVYPRRRSPSLTAPHRTAMPISRSVTRVTLPEGWNTVSRLVLGGRCLRLAMRRASAAIGQTGPPKASWWMTAPFVPFLVLAMQIVALSAVRSVASGAEWGRMPPCRHNRTSQLRIGMVRLSRGVPGHVYSPTLSR